MRSAPPAQVELKLPGAEVEQLRARVVIEGVAPEVEGGRFPGKGSLGESVRVEADVFAEGHEELRASLHWRRAGELDWTEVAMRSLPNDRWRAGFKPEQLGCYEFTVEGWVDPFATWARDLAKRVDAGQDVSQDLLIGADLVDAAAARAGGVDQKDLKAAARSLRAGPRSRKAAIAKALGPALATLMTRHGERVGGARYSRVLRVLIDPARARHGAWYEMFPRSTRADGKHGTFKDVEARLPYVAGMGFDVLYLPPIHPIGRTYRKGRDNSLEAAPDDPGSPWAIGSAEGGHKAIHPQLGTLADFRHLLATARDRFGMDVAIDIAFQTSPDHPYVKEHPEWFRKRPDGSIQYAENPPKKYQDIYPFDFGTEAWPALWAELCDVVVYWARQGVRIFRVDNPHTKPFGFWEWLISEVKREFPDAIFLAEAFTRPKIMYRLAKVGFSQSYTYFTWRTGKRELMEYFTELTTSPVRDFFRPNLWPNTPDILTEQMQRGGRPMFMSRLVLAATLGANYGIYGPAYELLVNQATPGREEYGANEKYEIKRWDLERPGTLRDFIAHVNRIRIENPALQSDRGLLFHPTDNEQLLCYSKSTEDGANLVLVVVNLDPIWTQSGFVDLRLDELEMESSQPFAVDDLVSGSRYSWQGSRNYVELNPHVMPAHIFKVVR